MFNYLKQQKKRVLFMAFSRLIVFVLSSSLIFSPTSGYAQSVQVLNLPVLGTMVQVSPVFVPELLKGMTIHLEDPLRFDFILDSGNTDFSVHYITSIFTF